MENLINAFTEILVTVKILALIPARSGSKRVPNKNIRLLGDKPLIVWTIESALNIPGICDVLVSTDSIEIQAISNAAGASAPWLRPQELATDDASSVDVAIHALDQYENENGEVDGLLLLQPTSPFRTKEYIVRGIEKYFDSDRSSVIGLSPIREQPSWMVTIKGDSIQWNGEKEEFGAKSDNFSALFIVNGGFYLTHPLTLRINKSFYSPDTKPLICDSIIESIDIDSEEEFRLSELYCSEIL